MSLGLFPLAPKKLTGQKLNLKKLLLKQPSEPPALLLREWGAVLGIFAFIAAVATVSECKRISNAEQINLKKASQEQLQIEICLKGAVQNPGVYRCDPGTALKELLKEAKFSKNADRKRVEFKKILYASQVIEIPEKKRSL